MSKKVLCRITTAPFRDIRWNRNCRPLQLLRNAVLFLSWQSFTEFIGCVDKIHRLLPGRQLLVVAHVICPPFLDHPD